MRREIGEWCEEVRYSPFFIKRMMKRYQFAVCINNTNYPASLEQFKVYQVLPDDKATENEDIRVIDESGEDYLFPKACFVPIEIPERVKQALLRAI